MEYQIDSIVSVDGEIVGTVHIIFKSQDPKIFEEFRDTLIYFVKKYIENGEIKILSKRTDREE